MVNTNPLANAFGHAMRGENFKLIDEDELGRLSPRAGHTYHDMMFGSFTHCLIALVPNDGKPFCVVIDSSHTLLLTSVELGATVEVFRARRGYESPLQQPWTEFTYRLLNTLVGKL